MSNNQDHDRHAGRGSAESSLHAGRRRRAIDDDSSHSSGGVWGRTGMFLLGGAGMLLLGWLAQPRYQSREVTPDADRVLFKQLNDVQKAASLEVLKYDEGLATLQAFKVVQAGGVWVLPSHQNYPADAKEHLAAAATELVDLKSLDVVSSSAADHETYGVIEPDPEKIKPGMTGVGELIEIRDAGGSKLARLVVGKEDTRRGSGEGGGKKLRFVRRAGEDPVYRVEVDTSKFTTRFDDWIEKDLLKLSPWDVRRVILDDYSLGAVESGGRVRVEQNRRDRIDVTYDDKDAKWSLVKLEAFGGGADPQVVTLGDREELAATKLNDLRNALGDLKIVDVVRKPAGLSADLKAEEKFTGDEEAVRSMQQRGFLPLKSGDILSTDGETIVGMKDGVEYVLRFGAGTSVGTVSEEPGDGGDSTGRYLLVMARFNEGLLEKPILDPLPEGPQSDRPEADEAAAAGEGEAKPAEGGAADLLKAADEAEAKAQAALEERRRIERENRRRQDDYDAKVKAAQRRVRDLNARFADWYYIVPTKEYAKIHLDRAAVIQAKGADAAEGGIPGGGPSGGGLPFGPGAGFPGGSPRAAPSVPPAEATPAAESESPAVDPAPADQVPATEEAPVAPPSEPAPAIEPAPPAGDPPPADEPVSTGESAPPSASEPAPAGS